jgi:hypothetical protein
MKYLSLLCLLFFVTSVQAQKSRRWSVSVYAQPELTYTKVQMPNIFFEPVFLSGRSSQVEKATKATTVGASVALRFRLDKYLSVGIGFEKVTRDFKSNIFVDPTLVGGQWGFVPLTTTSIKYQMWMVPMSARYGLPVTKNLKVYGQAALSAGMIHKANYTFSEQQLNTSQRKNIFIADASVSAGLEGKIWKGWRWDISGVLNGLTLKFKDPLFNNQAEPKLSYKYIKSMVGVSYYW